MDAFTQLFEKGRNGPCRPWPRVEVSAAEWTALTGHLVAGDLVLMGLWGDAGVVHMALREEGGGRLAVATCPCPDGTFPSVARHHAPAARLERTVRDLFGLVAEGAPDPRPWLDHGRWGVRHPLGTSVRAEPAGDANVVLAADAYPFLAAEGEGLHQIPVGPVHAGIIEPGHFRFSCYGETVVRLEGRLGYVHKGIEGLMAGADIAQAARLAGRQSGDSTVAYALAFCRAVEAARGIVVPERAHALRAVMAELERLANHLGDIGGICNDAAFALMLAHCGVLRELVLRASARGFGHRLMMDKVVPGGVACDLAPEGVAALRALVAHVRAAFPALVELYDNTASLQDRTVGTGFTRPDHVRQFGAGGYVGRASGRAFDARRSLPYPPYDRLPFEVAGRTEGDVNARVWVRIREVEESLGLIVRLLDTLPAGPVLAELNGTGEGRAGEGLAVVEGFRGDVLAFVALGAGGRVRRAHLRDPSWFQWPLLETAIEGNIVADFPLCNKSFNCSYSGVDL
ncbi:NADH-quinone oxidoreductase subunit C [Xanthobacter dioxanivorans]|uniref:NADH-quinone oxidoreductase subunit C n=1 Tax=Xanthobacter dioxanivorans TaxID=2528964 RepID=A0A974PIT0_9HYPH|nr:NADH-quinone oxidoreductase subunit C [Xanthobacter dioxanivorans]QRG04452.1 NADH-quinone oxidoreductase subunit C [Xanthobacter dioxanivorans]